jgi:hypothetical protein
MTTKVLQHRSLYTVAVAVGTTVGVAVAITVGTTVFDVVGVADFYPVLVDVSNLVSML